MLLNKKIIKETCRGKYSVYPLAILTFSSVAFSQDNNDEIELKEIVVTADKIATAKSKVGSSVSVITGNEMEEKNIIYVTDYLRQVPGISLYQSGPRGTVSRVFIRGAEDNHTLVLINGVEANDGSLGSAFDFSNLLAADIERIEIIRGSQSALWGSDAIGGVINIITKTGGDKDGINGDYRFEYGSFSSRYGSLATAFQSEDFDTRFSIQGEKTAGDSISPFQGENDGFENVTLDSNSNFFLTDNLSLNLFARWVDSELEYDAQDFSSEVGSDTFGRVVDADNESDTDQFYSKAELNWMSDNQSFEHILGFQYTDTENRFDEESGVSENNSDKSKFLYQFNHYRTMGSGNWGGDYVFTFGYEYEDEDYTQKGFSNQKQSTDQNSFVGQIVSDFENGLSLSASIRFDESDDYEDEVTYRTSASYQALKNTRLHGSYGTGLKNPTFTELYGFSPDSFIGNPGLDSETSNSFDIGVEQSFLNNKLVADITYFNTHLEDEIITTFDPETFIASVDNLDQQSERQGIETSLYANITNNWSANLSYTYLDAKGPDERTELRRPDHQFSLGSQYQFSKASLGLEVLYTDDALDNDFTTGVPTTVTLQDYTLVNLSGNFNLTENFMLTGRIENLFDKNYETVSGFDTTGIGAYFGIRGQF